MNPRPVPNNSPGHPPDFDMDDPPSDPAVDPRLGPALRHLAEEIGPRFHQADRRAIASQELHRRLANGCIGAGALAIILAIAQLALQPFGDHMPVVRDLAKTSEIIVVAAAAIAVSVGLYAKRHHEWIIQRHLAERFRSLKFQALGQPSLVAGETDPWKSWLKAEIAAIEATRTLDAVETWAASRGVEPAVPRPSSGAAPVIPPAVLADYFRSRRVEYQSAYFAGSSDRLRGQAGHWPHRAALFFFGSVGCVFLHILLHRFFGDGPEPVPGGRLDWHQVVGVALVFFSAVLPVVGFGVRAWFTAFELPRSATLFHAKHRALADLSERLQADSGDLDATLRHVAYTEHFLQSEHAEWIRLIRDTEWFL